MSVGLNKHMGTISCQPNLLVSEQSVHLYWLLVVICPCTTGPQHSTYVVMLRSMPNYNVKLQWIWKVHDRSILSYIYCIILMFEFCISSFNPAQQHSILICLPWKNEIWQKFRINDEQATETRRRRRRQGRWRRRRRHFVFASGTLW